MNLRDAWVFLSFGLVMGLLPVIAPAWFPPTALDGSSGHALWLELMGLVQTGIGGGCVLWKFGVPAFVRWLAYNTPAAPTPPPVASVLAFEPLAPKRPPALASASDGEDRAAA